MPKEDISDIYIKAPGDPDYKEDKLENTTFIDTVISKIYMILLTNKGDIFGDIEFGADIPKYLWKTKFSASSIQDEIYDQFNKYIPELSPSDYKLNVYILPGNIQDIGIIQIDLGVAFVNTLFK